VFNFAVGDEAGCTVWAILKEDVPVDMLDQAFKATNTQEDDGKFDELLDWLGYGCKCFAYPCKCKYLGERNFIFHQAAKRPVKRERGVSLGSKYRILDTFYFWGNV